MDKKEFDRKVKEHSKAKEQMMKDKQDSDRATHSESKSWNYDPQSGTLK